MALPIYMAVLSILSTVGVIAIMHHAPRMMHRAIYSAWWRAHVRRCVVQNRCL